MAALELSPNAQLALDELSRASHCRPETKASQSSPTFFPAAGLQKQHSGVEN
jgi:hypothetical protein